MADVALRSGAIIDDRYLLKRLLGAGGCGAVWLANAGDSDVVLKILHPHFDKFSIAVKQLAREAEILSQLAHPNIAKPFAFSAAGAHSYLVMEFIDGKTLDAEIGAHTRNDQHFENSEVVRIFEELCSAVAHAHSKTVIHRDLKPQNVMIVRRGGELFVKVLDFGIAKLLEGSIFDATTFGRRLGSMFYMSPEQCKGEQADERSDVFSLGAILFEILTLRRAWAWDNANRPLRAFDNPVPADGANALSSVLLRVASAPRPKVSDWRPKLSSRFDDLVARALAIDPTRRFAGVEPLLTEFRRAIGVHEGARPSKEFLTEIITVKSAAPAVASKAALYGDAQETKLDRPAEEERAKGNVWKIGGIQYNDKAATTMMKEAIDDDADETIPKLNLSGPMDADSSKTVGLRDSDLHHPARNQVSRTVERPEEVSITSKTGDSGQTVAGQDPFVTASNPRVKNSAKPASETDLNATWLEAAAVDRTPLDNLLPDPNATSLSGSLVLDPVTGASGGNAPATELMYAVPEVAKLVVTSDVSGDQTPVRAAQLRVTNDRPMKPVQPSSTDAEAAIDRGERPLVAVFSAIAGAMVRHRLAIVGLVGMLLAFVIGIVLARWAAQEVRPRPVVQVPLPAEKQKPLMPLPAPKKYRHLDAMLDGVRNDASDERLQELRDAILVASKDIPDEKLRQALRRKASSEARVKNVAGLAECIEELRRVE